MATYEAPRALGLVSDRTDRRHRGFGGSPDGCQGRRKIGSIQASPLHLRTALGEIEEAQGPTRGKQDVGILPEDDAFRGGRLKPSADLGSQTVEKIH
ncbi:hypothetical protein [Methylobacterium sp. Leaf465]|uniref:hypothetical protein n=1 Tax=Methylobacterium sp. Leaf465 TaxID=1736385 RepID=UPI003241F24E